MQRVTKHHGSHVYTLIHTKDQLILVTLPTGMFSGAQGNPKLQENQSCGAASPPVACTHGDTVQLLTPTNWAEKLGNLSLIIS